MNATDVSIVVVGGWHKYFWRLCPVMTVAIGLSSAAKTALRDAGLPVPAGLSVGALIDTGTSHTFADTSLFRRLTATPTGERVFAGGAKENEGVFDNYIADLVVPYTTGDHLVLRDWPISQGALAWPPGHPVQYELVLGNDILRRCRFTLDGPAGVFRLEPTS